MPDSGTITNYFASGARFARNVFMYNFEVAEARAAVARWPAARNAPADVGDQRDGGGWSARAVAEGVSLYPRYKFHVFDALGKLGGPLA
jgi:hypothetical protein